MKENLLLLKDVLELYKHMTAISKNVNFGGSDNIVDKCSNTYHSTVKIKPVDVKSDSYDKDPKFKIGDYVGISKYNIFPKGYIPNWSKEDFVISKMKYTVPWTYVINDLHGEETVGTFYEK